MAPILFIAHILLLANTNRSRHRRQRGDNQASLTTEEEEEIRQLFLVQQLSKYTLTISSDDIRMKDKLEADSGSYGSALVNAEDTDIEVGKGVPAVKSMQDDDDSSDDDHECVVEFEDSARIVTVPIAGESVLSLDRVCKTRDVTNGCAICLCEFDSMDQVTWAANNMCPHVFHSDCILQWMLALGRKEQKRRRRYPERSTGDPLKDVVTFPMLCPCCRQQFIESPTEVPSFTPVSSSLESNLAEEPQTTVPPEGEEDGTVEAVASSDAPSLTHVSANSTEETQSAESTAVEDERNTPVAVADNI